MFCKKCGKELKLNAKFCPGCGAAVSRPGAASPVAASFEPASNPRDGKPKATPRSNIATVSPSPVAASAQTDAREVTTGKNKKIAIIVGIVVAVLVVVGIIVGVSVKNATDAGLREETAAITSAWQAKAEAVSTQAADRKALLASYNELEALRSSLESAKQAGELKISNGSDCDVSDVIKVIDEKEAAIREWFASDYESRLASATLADGATADTVTREAAQSAADALAALKADIENEKAIWGSDCAIALSTGVTYADLLGRIETQIQRVADILAQIAAAEQAAAEAAAAEAAKYYTYYYYKIDTSKLPSNFTISSTGTTLDLYTKADTVRWGFITSVMNPSTNKAAFGVHVATSDWNGLQGLFSAATLPTFTDENGYSVHVVVYMGLTKVGSKEQTTPFTLTDGTVINKPQDLIDAGVVQMAQ